MKNLSKKVLSLILAFVLLISSSAVTLAVATDPVNETNAGIVTLSATKITLEPSENEQTVNVSLLADKNICVAGLTANYAVSGSDNNVTLGTGIPGNSLAGSITSQSMNVSNGSGVYMTYDSDNEGYVLCTVPVTVSTNATGTYTVAFSDIEITDAENGDGYKLESKTVTTTVSISEPIVEGYTAQVTAPAEVTAGTDFVVNVGVDHNEDDTFHAAEIVLEYDAAALTLKNISETQNLKYTNANGVLTVENFDEEHTMGTGVYTFTFTANANAGNSDTTVALTSAKFLDKAAASSSDLIDATEIEPNAATIKINEVTYTVTTAEGSVITGLTIPTEVTKGTDLVIEAANPNLYVYSITATIDGKAVTVNDDGNGTFTIPAASITGDIVLETSRTERTYSVTVVGDDQNLVGLPVDAPKYNTDYIFTIPEDQPPTTTSVGYTYSATVTVNGVDYDAEKDGLEYKIPGAAVVGDIVITLVTVEEPATPIPQVTVEVSGSTDVKVNGQDKVTVDEGTIVTLTLTKETGYDYVVKVGNDDITETIVATGTYNLQANATVTVSVTKNLITENLVQVYDYLTLDSQTGEKLWLVTFTPTLADGKIPTYNGETMFWSELDDGGYDAYCYLVKATSLTVDSAADELGTTTATAVEISYNGEINNTTIRDAADAQFVANMYNAMYKDMRSDGATDTTNPTMAMFLSADVNNDKKVSVLDAEKIVKMILGRND